MNCRIHIGDPGLHQRGQLLAFPAEPVVDSDPQRGQGRRSERPPGELTYCMGLGASGWDILQAAVDTALATGDGSAATVSQSFELTSDISLEIPIDTEYERFGDSDVNSTSFYFFMPGLLQFSVTRKPAHEHTIRREDNMSAAG